MGFQVHPVLQTAPGHLGAVVSFCTAVVTMVALIATALTGVGLVEW